MPALPFSYLIAQDVSHALAEDLGACDWTAQLIKADTLAQASIITREAAVLCGQAWFDECFRQVDSRVSVHWLAEEGCAVAAGQMLCQLQGPARGLLTGERTAMNFLQTLSAVASTTRAFVEAVQGTRAKILDTRKTLPGLRRAQKYAVTVGGGVNHRIGLYDGILIKENHIMAAGGIKPALQAAQQLAPPQVFIQVEVETLDELQQALDAGARLILLDNMDLASLRQAVQLTAGRAQLEASGGVNLDTVQAIAQTGVDRISLGSLTKDIRAIDLSMRFSH